MDETTMIFDSSLSSASILLLLITCYILLEVLFYVFVYCRILLPRAQEFTQVQRYRDYPNLSDRTKLFERILDRIERHHYKNSSNDGDDVVAAAIQQFFYGWLRPKETNKHPYHEQQTNKSLTSRVFSEVSLATTTVDISSNDDDDDTVDDNISNNDLNNIIEDDYDDVVLSLTTSSTLEEVERKNSTTTYYKKEDETNAKGMITTPGIGREGLDDFFAWAFFGKDPNLNMTLKEVLEMEKFYDILSKKYGLQFPFSGEWEARRLCYEPVIPTHRPFLFYFVVSVMKFFGNLYLKYVAGFTEYRTPSDGLIYWYRAAASGSKKRPPLLFFHGVGPGGKTIYLPFCLYGIGDVDRDMYLFENNSISCAIGFHHALSEDQTVRGVNEALQRHEGLSDEPLTLCGHSLGTCPITWLLSKKASPLRSRIGQIVLLDPVTINLSEPDVMVNFIYKRNETHHPPTTSLIRYYSDMVIQCLASSELFIQHYIRRHFSWYNSELWLEDILTTTTDDQSSSENQNTIQILVGLSENDTIVCASKAKREVQYWQQQQQRKNENNLQLKYYENVSHGHCCADPRYWKDIYATMMQQEKELLLQHNRRTK